MKTDIEDAPARLPKKRQALKRWPDIWIAKWLDRPDLDPHERERLEAEKASRKRSNVAILLGVLAGREGITPEQRTALREHIGTVSPAGVVIPVGFQLRLPGTVIRYEGLQEVVRESTWLIAFPREMRRTLGSDVWEAERYCRHRRVPVRVVLPNGSNWTLDPKG